MGDGGGIRAGPQRRDNLEGKILRLDVDRAEGGRAYAIPPDNPYRNGPFLPEVWATGLRNPWRFSFDRLHRRPVDRRRRPGRRSEEIDVQPAGQRRASTGAGARWEGSLCFGANACPASVPVCNAPGLALAGPGYAHGDGNSAR